jgi:TNF receptor-associated protein 1
MGRMEPSVSLYSRKVLIEAKSPNILPEWMRFIKGVVDSEDLPLSVSREKAQDSALIGKLRKALTRKFINHMTTMARKDPEKYKDEFYKEYSFFLKEGVCQDYEFQEPLSKLLYYETSKTMNGEISSLEDYLSRCTPDQKEIYYLCAPSRELAIQSPYLEAFEKAGKEVIFVYSAIDDFVMANLDKFQGRKIVSAEKGGIDLGDKDDEVDEDENEDQAKKRLNQKEADEFCAWFQVTLNAKVATCKTTNRLASSPAVVTDNESGAMRRMMQMVETQEGGPDSTQLPKQQVEINPKHPMIAGLYAIREKEPALAKILAEQIFDNCLIAAGLLDDGRSMLGRLNDILLCVVNDASSKASK